MPRDSERKIPKGSVGPMVGQRQDSRRCAPERDDSQMVRPRSYLPVVVFRIFGREDFVGASRQADRELMVVWHSLNDSGVTTE